MEECLGGYDRVEVEGGEPLHEAIVRGGEVVDKVPVEDHPVRPAHPLQSPGQTPSAFNDMTCFPHIANIPNAMIYLEIYRNICRISWPWPSQNPWRYVRFLH